VLEGWPAARCEVNLQHRDLTICACQFLGPLPAFGGDIERGAVCRISSGHPGPACGPLSGPLIGGILINRFRGRGAPCSMKGPALGWSGKPGFPVLGVDALAR